VAIGFLVGVDMIVGGAALVAMSLHAWPNHAVAVR